MTRGHGWWPLAPALVLLAVAFVVPVAMDCANG